VEKPDLSVRDSFIQKPYQHVPYNNQTKFCNVL